MSDKLMISAQDPHPRKRIAVRGTHIAYVDKGRGTPIVFLHGNPTSSYLWRNVIPYLDDLGRCLAPDLVGMGDSGKAPDGAYRFTDHAGYLDAWFDALGLHDVVLVVHDWGSALGFRWAFRNPTRVKALAYMEAIVQPLRWEDWNQQSRPIFEALRGPAGEEIVLQKNQFVERILPGSIIRKLSEPEMAAYRRPWVVSGEARRPMLQWPREIPIDGEPPDVVEIASNYSRWLSRSAIPKLFVNANPGAILVGAQREFCRTWLNQREVSVNGIHFIQEDSPHEIGAALADWYRSL